MSEHIGTVANIDVHTFSAGEGAGRMVQVNFMRDYAQLTPGQVDSLRELLALAARDCRKKKRRSGFIDRRALFLLVAFLLGILVGCAPSQLMAIQCPESARTYCPAQHFPADSARRGK
jgi:hypothetical protein